MPDKSGTIALTSDLNAGNVKNIQVLTEEISFAVGEREKQKTFSIPNLGTTTGIYALASLDHRNPYLNIMAHVGVNVVNTTTGFIDVYLDSPTTVAGSVMVTILLLYL